MGLRGMVAAAAAATAMLVAAAPAAAEVTSVFGGAVACEKQDDGTRFCGGANTHVATFDGLAIDVNVALPPAPASGRDGDYPLVMVFHGYGGSELGLSALQRWTRKGYAAFSMSDRGFGRSCGGKDQLAEPACASGYIRLMDTRYEVRDAQTFAGMLVDEGIVDRKRIGAAGGSYGGGLSMSLAALRNRVMLEDGSLTPWVSPAGKPMRIAAAIPEIPWTDLANALMPNGATLDYVADAPYGDRIGVLKQTFVAGLFASGLAAGRYAEPGTDPDADVITWWAAINAGEPYEGNPIVPDVLDEVTTHHSSYYIDHSIAPAPLLISNGWTDDLFPVNEAIRFYNRTRSEHPKAPISLFFLDYGHMRGQNKAADIELLKTAQARWLGYYVKRRKQGKPPFQGVQALTQTCPKGAPSAGPYSAESWATIARGEIRMSDAAARTIAPLAADTAGLSYDPVAGGGACATAPSPSEGVVYDFPAASGSGFTLLGAPTVIADVDSPGPHSQIAARLLDVAPDGRATLVARGLFRPAQGAARRVLQLNPNGYRFAAGHVARVQLLPADVPYSRITTGQLPVTLSNAEVRLPVRQRPAKGGPVKRPAPKVLPSGYALAPGYKR